MNNTDQLFFELIRVAIGTQETLSRPPSGEEWKTLYDKAKKQSLVGICFAGVQRLKEAENPSFFTLNSSLYLMWMGMAAKIQHRNDVVNRQCRELQAKLSADGFRSCVLKGQGVAQLYNAPLRELRQSGDIDVWLKGGLDAALRLSEIFRHKPTVAEHHIDLPVFDDSSTCSGEHTDVEIHFIPTYMRCPWHHKRLQKWLVFSRCVSKEANAIGIITPTIEFNLVFLMLHAYRHLTSEGVGMRQVMDYYFALLSASDSQRIQAYNTLCELGAKRFCGAMMYVLEEVFGMKSEELLCEPDEKEGLYLLNEIMTGGNFGHHDDRVKVAANESKMARFVRQTKRNVHQLTHYPTEAFFSPWWRAKIWAWRKWNGWI